jgi:hypothetical protein
MDSDSDDGLPSVGELNREVAGLRTSVAKQVSEALAIHECLRGLLRQNQLVSTACAAYFTGGTLFHLAHVLFCTCVARRGGVLTVPCRPHNRQLPTHGVAASTAFPSAGASPTAWKAS